MKKLLWKLVPRLAKPIIYKVITRCVCGLLIGLLWNRFINTWGIFTLVDGAFFVIGAVFIAMAWFSYLKLDGLGFIFPKIRKIPQKPRHSMKNMSDYTEEEPESPEPLNENEQALAAFAANLLSGLVFLIPSIIAQMVSS